MAVLSSFRWKKFLINKAVLIYTSPDLKGSNPVFCSWSLEVTVQQHHHQITPMDRFIILLLLVFNCICTYGQNKVVAVIGSSTAAGFGASVPDSSWVRRLSNHYKTQGVLDTIYNRAKGGLNSYHGMPTSYTPPPGRPFPMPDSNITRAISFNPDVILITYVSNNFDTYSIEEIKATLFTIFDSATAAGKVAFVSTTQPRTGFSDAGRLQLRKLKDSIMKWFGNYAINFWNPIADSSNNTIAAAYRYATDDIHINDAGHRVLFEQVLAKNIFNVGILPVKLKEFTANFKQQRVHLQWKAESDDPHGVFHVQKSNDGENFLTIKKIKAGKGIQVYSTTDIAGNHKNVFYRLEIHEYDRVHYSPVLAVKIPSDGMAVASIFPVPARETLNVLLTGTRKGKGRLSIVNSAGSILKTVACFFDDEQSSFTIPLLHLSKGSYYLRVDHSEYPPLSYAFQKY